MTILDPLDPFSEVVDERRRWRPDWYSWLRRLVDSIPAASGDGGDGGGGDTSTATTRFAATRCRWLTSSDNTKFQIMAYSGHRAWADITQLEIYVQNARNSPVNINNDFLGEVGLGAPATVTASIEYPPGTFTQVLFSNIPVATVSDISILKSNLITLPTTIPEDAIFGVRQFWTNPNGVLFNNWQDNATYGDKVRAAASGLTDMTMGGTIVDNTGWSFPPAAIVAVHNKMSVGVVGDSIGYGNVGPPHEAAPFLGGTGTIAKSLISLVPTLNLSQCGAGAAVGITNRYWLSSGTIRRELVKYCTVIACELVVNDLIGFSASSPQTAAQEIANLQALWTELKTNWGLPPDATIIQATCSPHSSSIDGWTSVGGQTGEAEVVSGERGLFNDAVRALIPGSDDYYEIAGALESALNSGLWAVSGTNLLVDSNSFNTAHWFQSQLTSFNSGAADPFAGTDASTMIENSGGGPHFASNNVAAPAGTYVASVYAKSSTRRAEIRVAAFGGTDFVYAVFDLVGGQVGTTGTGGSGYSTSSQAITPESGGWFRCSMVLTCATPIDGFFLVLDNATGTAALSQNYVGDGSSNVVFTRSMLQAGSVLSPWEDSAPVPPTNDGLHPTDAGYAAISVQVPLSEDARTSGSVVNLIDSASGAITLDASQGNQFKLVATGNRTIQVPLNPPSAGDSQEILIAHEASGGSRLLSLAGGAGGFRFGTDITGLTSTPSGKTDYIGAVWNENGNRWDVTSYVRGF